MRALHVIGVDFELGMCFGRTRFVEKEAVVFLKRLGLPGSVRHVNQAVKDGIASAVQDSLEELAGRSPGAEMPHGDIEALTFAAGADIQPGKVEALPGFETADEAVASIGKTAIAGYTFKEGSGGNGGEGPENIWDGDTATKFCTGEFPISSTAELDGWYKVDGIVMATANDNAEYNGRLPSAWTVSGSADGENWTVIASGDESFFDEVNFRYFAGDASSDAVKFVKFDAEGASSGCFQISELVLTGAKTDAPAAPVDQTLDQKAEAPNTFDFGILAAVASVLSLGGFALTRKKH